MKIYTFTICVLLACVSCSMQKKRHDHTHGQIEIRAAHTSLRDSLINRWEDVHVRNGLLLQREWATVIPDGNFSFDIDSGFSGRAVGVLFYSERLQQESQWDSSARTEQQMTGIQEDSLVVLSQQLRNLRTETDVRTRNFFWLLLPAVFAVVFWFWRRARR